MYLVEVEIVTVIEQKQHSSWSGYINEASLTEIAAYPMCDIGAHSHKKPYLNPLLYTVQWRYSVSMFLKS